MKLKTKKDKLKKVLSITLTIHDCDDLNWELMAFNNARTNQANIDSLYQDVFRNTIKYGNDEKSNDIHQEILDRCIDHFENN